MNTRVVVDPVTRIEGHLRIEAERSNDGQITSAYSSGTMVRGIELILQGRPGTPMPGWAPFMSENEAQWLAESLVNGVPDEE